MGKCLVDSGIFGVPSELVAQTMCEAVTKFCCGEEHHSRLGDIHLVDINTAMVKLLQENFEQQSSTPEENSQFLREHYQCLETSSGEKVVEDVFTPEGQDSALVIFTHEK